MVRGGCKHCGQQTPNSRLCKECQRLERQDFFVTDVSGAEGADTQRKQDIESDEPGEQLEYECTACGESYEGDGSEACPACGARRRRYVGPLPGEATAGGGD